MIEWNEMHLQIREMMRRFVEAEVKPNLEALEHGDLPPYEILRKMIKSFGIADMAKARFARDKDRAPRSDDAGPKKPSEERGMEVAMQMIPIIEL
ncbi:MAG: acyl-CoA dehydrogenase family protein, partial [Polyangia bacterium]